MYRLLVAPLLMSLGTRCRFEPSCSHYASESIRRFGPARGSLLAAARLSRCHPFCRGGEDPVPQNFPVFNWKKVTNG